MTLYFDDLRAGYRYGIRAPRTPPYGVFEVTAEEIVAFAERFDPRPQHVDEAAARQTSFGGLIGSGAHAFAIWTRIAFEAGQSSEPVAIIAGLGSDYRMRRPIRPGDRFDLAVEIVDLRASRSRPEAGIMTARHRLSNQRGELVLENRATSLVARRPAEKRRG